MLCCYTEIEKYKFLLFIGEVVALIPRSIPTKALSLFGRPTMEENLPFVEHIAFMGLEYQGYTPYNIDKLWVDPTEYMNELTEAAEFLSSRRMNVSIHNSQLCLMPRPLWKFTKKSISDWKNIYLKECSHCTMIKYCGGLFASSEKMHSKNIKAFN